MNNWLLSQVKEGMAVVDANGDHIGTVKSVYFGGDSEQMNRNDPYQNTFADFIARAFAVEPDIPETLRNRMEQEGFIVVDRTLAIDPYVLPEQVHMVSDNSIILRTAVDELLTR